MLAGDDHRDAAACTTAVLTEPSSIPAYPPRPWLPTTAATCRREVFRWLVRYNTNPPALPMPLFQPRRLRKEPHKRYAARSRLTTNPVSTTPGQGPEGLTVSPICSKSPAVGQVAALLRKFTEHLSRKPATRKPQRMPWGNESVHVSCRERPMVHRHRPRRQLSVGWRSAPTARLRQW